MGDYNEVVGYSGTALDDHAFYWSRETGMVELSDLGHPPGAAAYDINDAGVVVGYAGVITGPSTRAAVAWHGGVPYELNELLVNGQGWDLHDARGINELGQIVGMGRYQTSPWPTSPPRSARR